MNEKEKKALDKAEAAQRAVVRKICNKLRMQYSFGNIRTFGACYFHTFGDESYKTRYTPEECAKQFTVKDLEAWEKKLHDDLEEQLKNRRAELEGVAPKIQAVTPAQAQQPTAPSLPPTFQPASHISKPAETESKDDASNDYGLAPSPLEKGFLYWFQKKSAAEILTKLVEEKKPAVLLIASTGTGKTFIAAAVDRRLKDIDFTNGKTFGPSPYLHVTRATVVEQTKRVNERFFSISHPSGTEVLNIEQLRSRAGQLWIQNETVIVNGEEQEVWKWKPYINPAVVFLDECQTVKNEDSTQHKILLAYSELQNTAQIYISATPFTRVSEAKAFAIATKKDISHLGFPSGTKLSAHNWHSYASAIAAPSAPEEYNEAAVERLMKDLDDYIVRVKGVRWQFNAINKVEVINFTDDEERKEYESAWERYLIRKAKLEETVTDNPRFQAMVELMMFLRAAEYCKRRIFAKRMYEDVQAGYAAVLGVKNKNTIVAVVKILVEEYGVSRDDISLIWGGGQTQLTAKQKLKAQIESSEQALQMLQAAGISMEDLALEEVESRTLEDLPPELRLGSQSREERQREIDKFQSGRSKFAIFTYKAGGVGLSLHHTDEFTKYKVRRKSSGYAYEEDIPNVPVRPRKVTIGPTWSPIDLVQAVGRVPRLTSLSNSEQRFLYYKGTVEEQQAFVVTHRLKCLTKVVKQRENWQDIITNHEKSKEIALGLVEKNLSEDTEDDLMAVESEVEEEESKE